MLVADDELAGHAGAGGRLREDDHLAHPDRVLDFASDVDVGDVVARSAVDVVTGVCRPVLGMDDVVPRRPRTWAP
jgi:hypothetical protein